MLGLNLFYLKFTRLLDLLSVMSSFIQGTSRFYAEVSLPCINAYNQILEVHLGSAHQIQVAKHKRESSKVCIFNGTF